MTSSSNAARPPFQHERYCTVPECGERAPGSHPMCRRHAAMVDRGTYLQLRFAPTDELYEKVLREIAP